MANDFEKLIVWQKSMKLVLFCYKCLNNIKDYSFKDQLCRAAVSIMNNIAEGFERKGDKEFGRFLYISKGSCGELRSMSYLAKELDYISQNEFDLIYSQSLEVSKMLSGLISKMN